MRKNWLSEEQKKEHSRWKGQHERGPEAQLWSQPSLGFVPLSDLHDCSPAKPTLGPPCSGQALLSNFSLPALLQSSGRQQMGYSYP